MLDMPTMRALFFLSVSLSAWACSSLPVGTDAGDDGGSDVLAPDALEPTDAGDANTPNDAGSDVVLRTATEWVLPIDMDGDPQSIASDSQGNVIIAGQNSAANLFFTKFDPYGNVIWNKVFAGGEDGTSVVIDSSDNVILVGEGFGASFSVGGSTLGGGSFVAKFAPDGTHVWSKRLVAGQFDISPCVVLGASDSVIAGGRFQGNAAVAGGPALSPAGAYAVKLDSTGALVWSKALGGGDTPHAATADGSGGAILVGEGATCGASGAHYAVHVDSSGTCTGAATAGYAFDVVADSSGNSYVTIGASTQNTVCNGVAGFMLAKLDPSFSTVWSKCFQGGNPQMLARGLLAQPGNVLATGAVYGAPDASADLGGGSIVSTNMFVLEEALDGGYVGQSLWPVAGTTADPYYLAPAPSSDLYLFGGSGGAVLAFGDASVLAPLGFLARVKP